MYCQYNPQFIMIPWGGRGQPYSGPGICTNPLEIKTQESGGDCIILVLIQTTACLPLVFLLLIGCAAELKCRPKFCGFAEDWWVCTMDTSGCEQTPLNITCRAETSPVAPTDFAVTALDEPSWQLSQNSKQRYQITAKSHWSWEEQTDNACTEPSQLCTRLKQYRWY